MLKRANNPVHQTLDDDPGFQSINQGYNSVFRPNHSSLGLVVPLATGRKNTRHSTFRSMSVARVEAAGGPAKPAVQSLYVDLTKDPQAPPQPIHLGFRLGANHLRAYLKSLDETGVNPVALNLRFNQADTEQTLQRLADHILPEFS